LVRKTRIRGALEEALDLLYPNANEELRDVMTPLDSLPENGARGLHARFYRFLDRNGSVIRPANSRAVGLLSAEEEAKLALPKLPETSQLGYLENAGPTGPMLSEIIATPIV